MKIGNENAHGSSPSDRRRSGMAGAMTAAALLRAELQRIEAEERAELLSVSTRLHQVRTLYSEWQAKVSADARERGERLRQLRRHSQSIKEQKKQQSAIWFRAWSKRKRARKAHAVAQREGESRSGEAADDPYRSSPQQQGPAIAPTQAATDARLAAFRKELGEIVQGQGAAVLHQCCSCHHALFVDECPPCTLLTVSKFLELRAIRSTSHLEEPRLEWDKGVEGAATHLWDHDFTGAVLHVPTREFMRDDSGVAWATEKFGDDVPEFVAATVLRRAARGMKPGDIQYGKFEIEIHAVDDTDEPLQVKRDYHYIAQRLAVCTDATAAEHGRSSDEAHPLRREYPLELREMYDVTVHPETRRLFEKYAQRTSLTRKDKATRCDEVARLRCLMLGFGGIEVVKVRGSGTGRRRGVREPRMRVCTECLGALNAGNLPKFSIANKYAIGWLPREIERLKPTDMEWALAQPVHHFQYLLTFNRKTHKLVPTLAAPKLSGPQASQGHLHMTKLNVPLVAKAVPHRMNGPPVRAVVASGTTEALRSHSNWLQRFAPVRRRVVCALSEHGIQHNHNAYAEYDAVDSANVRSLPEHDENPAVVVQGVASMNAGAAASATAVDGADRGACSSRCACASVCQQEDDTRSDANSDFDVGSDEGEDNDVERDVSRSARCGASDVSGARGAREAMHDTSVVMVSTTMSVAPVDIIHGSSDNATAELLRQTADALDTAVGEDSIGGVVGDGEADQADGGPDSGNDSEDLDDLLGDSGSGDDDGGGDDGGGGGGGANLHVRPSNKRVAEWEEYFFERAFVRAFPWGRGGPSERRRVHVSLDGCLKHYMRLHLHLFFKTGPFVLAAYDVSAKRKASTGAFLRCRFGSRGEDYAAVTAEGFRLVAEHKAACHAAAKNGAPRPEAPASLAQHGVDADFLRSIEYATRQMKHSHGRTQEARKEAHSYGFEFGKPTWFVTLNKNDGRCLEICALSEEDGGGSTPCRKLRYDLLGRFPGAAALSFDRLVRLFVKHLLAWDEVNRRPFFDEHGRPMKGIFGETQAFFGPAAGAAARVYDLCTHDEPSGEVGRRNLEAAARSHTCAHRPFEEQTRLSLHLHLEIWVRAMTQMPQRMLHPEAGRRMEEVIDAAVSTSTMLPPRAARHACRCPHCGTLDCWEFVKDWENFRYARQGSSRRTHQAKALQCRHCKRKAVASKRVRDALNTTWAAMCREAQDGTGLSGPAAERLHRAHRLFIEAVVVQRNADAAEYGSGGGGGSGVGGGSAESKEGVPYRLTDHAVLAAIVFHRLIRHDPRSPDCDEVDAMLAAAVIFDNQSHDDKHTSTCLKNAQAMRTGICRFKAPWQAVPKTVIRVAMKPAARRGAAGAAAEANATASGELSSSNKDDEGGADLDTNVRSQENRHSVGAAGSTTEDSSGEGGRESADAAANGDGGAGEDGTGSEGDAGDGFDQNDGADDEQSAADQEDTRTSEEWPGFIAVQLQALHTILMRRAFRWGSASQPVRRRRRSRRGHGMAPDSQDVPVPASSYTGVLRNMRHANDRNCMSPTSAILSRVAAFLGLDASRTYQLLRRRDALDMWLTAHNPVMSVALLCNNNIQYVVNACVAFYTACYSSKSQSDNAKLLATCIGAVTRKLRQLDAEASDGALQDQALGMFKRGLRLLHAGWYGHSRAEVVGSHRAALFLLGRGSHLMSHEVVNAGVGQLLDYVEGKRICRAIGEHGLSVPHAIDYVHRPCVCEDLPFLSFRRRWERQRLTESSGDANFMRTTNLDRRSETDLRDMCRNLRLAYRGVSKTEMVAALRERLVEDTLAEFRGLPFVEVGLPTGDDGATVSTPHPKAHQSFGVRRLRARAWRVPVIQHCRLPSLDAIRPDLTDLAASPLSENARGKVETSREEYGRMACMFTRPFRTKADLMLGQATWWAAWLLQKDALERERFDGLCAGRRDRRALYGTDAKLRAAMLEARRDELRNELNAAREAQRKKARWDELRNELNAAQRKSALSARATSIAKLQASLDALTEAIAQVRQCCGAASEELRAHRLICRDCREAGAKCAHDVPLDERCSECDAQQRRRRLALEGLDFLRFQQEYFHERNNCTIDDVSAGGKELNSAAKAMFDDDCHLDDDCMADIDAKLLRMKLDEAQCNVNADCLDGAGTVTPAANSFKLSDDAMDYARSAELVLTDAQRADIPTPEQRVTTDANGVRVFGTIVVDMVDALRANGPSSAVERCASEDDGDAPVIDTAGRSIDAVSAHFTLNTAQHTATCCAATALLHSLAKRLQLPDSEMAKLSPHMGCVPTSDDGASRQLVMYLTGAGGTGKSEVVKALREFAQRWGIADSLCVTATTGIAACIVHGMTWHKATGHFSFMRKAKTVKVREMWSTIAMLVIDEVSMMSARQLHQLDKWLRDLKGEPEKLFGGVHVIFCGMEITCVQQLWKYIEFIKYGYNELIDMHIWCTYAIQHATDTNKPTAGDFFQLPPVKARTVYDDGRDVDGDDALGRDLWRRVLNAVVVLTENHRAKLDPAYAELLRILRTGTDDASVWKLVTQALRARRCGVRVRDCDAWAQLAKRMAQRAAAAVPTKEQEQEEKEEKSNEAKGGAEQEMDAEAEQDDEHGRVLRELAMRIVAVARKAHVYCLGRAWRKWAQTEPMVITPRNAHRIGINKKFAQTHIAAVNKAVETQNPNATWRKRGVLIIDAVFHRYRPHQRDPPRYDQRWQKTWRRMTTEETMGNKYAPILRVLIGKRYMVTQNINLSRGAGNGMWAIVRDVRLHEGAVPRWDATEGAYRIDADQVDGIIVRYPDRDWGAQQLHPDLPVGHFIIVPDTPRTAPAGSKKFNFNLGGNVKKFRITALPLIQVEHEGEREKEKEREREREREREKERKRERQRET